MNKYTIIKEVIKSTAYSFNVELPLLYSNSNDIRIVACRKIIYYILNVYFNFTATEIAIGFKRNKRSINRQIKQTIEELEFYTFILDRLNIIIRDLNSKILYFKELNI
jgi:chromosomal replication initiation ATPase DnaA